MTITANDIFHFLRGALRGSFGKEDLRERSILLIGMDVVAQQLLTMLCMDDTKIFFLDRSIVNYDKAHMICSGAAPYEEEKVDVIVNLVEGFINIKDKTFPTCLISKDSYQQGIHEYYLSED